MTLNIQNRVSAFIQRNPRPGQPLAPVSVTDHTIQDFTIPYAGTQQITGRDRYGNPINKLSLPTPPSGLISGGFEWEKRIAPDFLEDMARTQKTFNVWEMSIPTGRVDLATQWKRLDIFSGLRVTQLTNGQGPVRTGEGGLKTMSVTTEGLKHTSWSLWQQLADTAPAADDFVDVIFLSDIDQTIPGYPGEDLVGYAITSNGNAYYTINGGGTWTAMSTAQPAGGATALKGLAVVSLSDSTFRLIVGDADATSAIQVHHQIITHGNYAGGTWTSTTIDATTAAVTAMLATVDAVYVAGDGEIFQSTNNGASYLASSIGGSPAGPAINDFVEADNGTVIAVGATNTIISKAASAGSFSNLTGPNNGNITAIGIGYEGQRAYLFAGVGQYIYRSDDFAATVANWVQAVDLGASNAAVKIHCANRISQLVHAIVDGNTGPGQFHYSYDGGNSFTQLTTVGSDPFAAGWFSPTNPNLAYMVGGSGNLQKLSIIG